MSATTTNCWSILVRDFIYFILLVTHLNIKFLCEHIRDSSAFMFGIGESLAITKPMTTLYCKSHLIY